MELFKIFGVIGLKGVADTKKQLNDVNQDAEQTSSKFSKIGGVLSKVGKGVLIATGAVATGAVSLIKSVSSSYGALQQSIGGIETLFGKSAEKVITNANNAFKTAGISANDYMQQVTSFSASLLQALGGDTEKAADTADMAIRDMADNANKMGTSMEMIQNAYQGFAKQNYTMLDNLKLGYGGTKTEMERLLADAQKITGIKYDISNLNDVYQAIHVIQGELGITGTTALEAGETIEGSFNSLGAAWQNFLAGLGDPNADMRQLVENLASGIQGAINNVIPIIDNMVAVFPTVMDALINAISSMLPTLIETFTQMIVKVIDAIVALLPQFIPLAVNCVLTVVQALIENLPLIIQAGIQLVLGLAKGIADALPQLMPTIIKVVKEIIKIIIENLPLILEIGTELLLALIQGIVAAIPDLVDMIPEIIESIVTTLINNLPLIIECGLKIILALNSGLINSIPKLASLALKLPATILKSIISAFPQLFNAGKQILNQVWNGMKQIWNSIVSWFSNIGKSIGNFFSGLFGFTKTANVKLNVGREYYADGGVMTKPTAFGYNPATGNTMVGGEAGAEAIAPISTLQQYVGEAVKAETDGITYYLDKLINLLGVYLPDIRDNMGKQSISLDGKELVNGIVDRMDNALGVRIDRKARYGV